MGQTITVEVIASFDGMRRGEVVSVELTPRIKGIIACGLLKDVTADGVSKRGPDRDPARRKASRTRRDHSGDAPGGEPSEDPGTGGHGQAESVDPQ